LNLSPNLPRSHYERGLAYHQAKKYDLAIADFTETIKRKPQLAAAYQARGQAYQAKGLRLEAQRDLQRSRELERQSPR
jgi:tetratricopeptide (TPR) repeat protein